MLEFSADRTIPKFILADKNGYAIAKAIEWAMNYFNERVDAGVKLITSIDTMPEWRLDETAWEMNCLYDYKADIEKKRDWIRKAYPMYRLYGMPEAIYQYLYGYFNDVELEENWQYDGEPFHFRVTVDGEWDAANEAWARKAIKAAKNVRSVLDALRAGCTCNIAFSAECELVTRFEYPVTGPILAGIWPDINTIGVITGADVPMEATCEGHQYPYPFTGTKPEESTIAATDKDNAIAIESLAESYQFGYQMTGNSNTGTIPDINTLSELQEDIRTATAEYTYQIIPYKLCGEDEF